MKQFRYKHYNVETDSIPMGVDYKEPEVWAEEAPDSDYIDVTTEESYILYEKGRYIEREEQGHEYSNLMDARLVVLGNMIPNSGLSETVRNLIDEMLAPSRVLVSSGRWMSAKRQMSLVSESAELQGLIDAYSLPVDQEELIKEINDRIDLAILELY